MGIRHYDIEQIARNAISIVLLIIAGANCHAQEQVTLRRVEITGLKRLNRSSISAASKSAIPRNATRSTQRRKN